MVDDSRSVGWDSLRQVEGAHITVNYMYYEQSHPRRESTADCSPYRPTPRRTRDRRKESQEDDHSRSVCHKRGKDTTTGKKRFTSMIVHYRAIPTTRGNRGTRSA